jgi:hypothetical protein
MIAIYSNNYSTDYYIQKLKFSQQYQVYHSIDQYITSDANIKLAFVNHLNSYDFPESEQQRLEQIINGRKFSQEIDQVKQFSDLVFAFDNEIQAYHQELFRTHSQAHVYWVVPGVINTNQMVDQQNVIVWNAHFDLLTYHYQTLAEPLQKLKNNLVKPLCFDVLLGNPRKHRDFVYDSVMYYNLQPCSILTYMNNSMDDFKTKFAWEPDITEFTTFTTRPTDQVMYYGQQMALSIILPIQVYNQTAYSIVAETGASNWYSFFTEKTAKPMMARRLFVMFSGQNFLHNLRELGFRTFGTVIDESYDTIYNNQKRWAAAFEQVRQLCNMDQTWVFDQIADTVEHNYNLLMNTNWNQHMLAQLQQKLDNSI